MVNSHLAEYLLENTDLEIHGICRWPSPQDNVEHLIPKVNKGDEFSIIDGDLCDYISLQNGIEEVRPDYVFHLVAQSYPQTGFISPALIHIQTIRKENINNE